MSYTIPAITHAEIASFSAYIYDLSGIELGQEKGYLLENRFSWLMEELECPSFTELLTLSKSNSSKNIEKKLLDAITTHETFFFRDNAPFELLKRKIIPELISQRSTQRTLDLPMPLSIWSAACSAGQEVYSVAMLLHEILGADLGQYCLRLLGTDISEKAIKKATSGSYNNFEMKRGLSVPRTMRFFQEKEETWEINNEVRVLASFRRMNIRKSFQVLGKFDIILCRNIASYFPKKDRNQFFKDIARSMVPDGYLIIGATETLNELPDLFVGRQEMGATYYQLR